MSERDARAALHAAAAEWVGLDDAEQEALDRAFALRRAEPGVRILLPGSDRHEVLFVAAGLLRFYYVGADGDESNKAFVAGGDWAGSLGAARLGLPVAYGIEALEPTAYLAALWADWLGLMDAEGPFDRLGRGLAERLLARKERRARALLVQDARARYERLLADEPHVVQRVPLYHVASYLGVTPTHLSRVRREVSAAPAGTAPAVLDMG